MLGIIRVFSGSIIRSLRRNSLNHSPRNLQIIQKEVKHLFSPYLSVQYRFYSNLPPHTKITLPSLSPTMNSGSIASWVKKEGDQISEGDVLAQIETDKATMDFEADRSGFLAKIVVPVGVKDVPVGKVICIVVENKSDIDAFKNYKDDSVVPAPAAAPVAPASTPAPQQESSSSPKLVSTSTTGRVYASPLARTLAEQRNIQLKGKGTGLYDSITSSDLDGIASAPAEKVSTKVCPSKARKTTTMAASVPSSFQDIPISGIRKVIASRLLESKLQNPHYYVTRYCIVDNVLKLRANINKKYAKQKIKLSVNDFIVKAAAIALRKVPTVNSSWMDTVIRQYKNADISIAVATDTGLFTPIVFEADTKGVIEISKNVRNLAGKARAGKLSAREYQGGTFTISNLGMYNLDQFCAIINPPQSSILAVGTTTKKLVADKKAAKGFKEVKLMAVTLSCDHRVVDGALAAEWLQKFSEHLEQPETMIL